ncbi:MAG: 16S rRNA (cytidine(1402)-2'-O)-methyltransferase [Anaeromyxobacter sp.]|nr:16S rRNA (cytidine(1402)-2'-O)-methyltransferase [Anaeromyxobacter sp.]MBL0277688.1 16S rRNA (cytidine(1402)-2'-O)-methyltransferase [Anaeromyxobacter sp.]
MSGAPVAERAPGRGTLYVVATPIGHLGDLTPRAAEVLRTVDAVAAEDTRRTAQLYAHLGAAAPPLLSLPAFDERGRLEVVVSRLAAGQVVALCTDAGTPGISDPGAALVAAAWEVGARVVPVPGASAVLAALSASGLPADRFFFAGFLPRKGGGRAEQLAFLAGLPCTLVLYEAGNRTADTLRDLVVALGDRVALVARELTKLHEELARGRLSELAARFDGQVRGEVTVVVAGGGAAAPPAPLPPLDDELRRRLAAGEPPSGVAREVARARGLKRADVYDALERLKRGG